MVFYLTLLPSYDGCPLSILLYITADEVLASFIDTDKRIKEMQIGDHEIKLIALADDTNIFVSDVNRY